MGYHNIMTLTEWKFKVYLFVRAVDATAANRQALAQILVDNGGMEVLQDELKMFDSVHRFSLTGEEPAQVYGLSIPAKLAMRDDFVTFLGTLTNARYAVTANTDLVNYDENELILTNFPITPNGQLVTWDTALNYLENEFGLIEIPREDDEV